MGVEVRIVKSVDIGKLLGVPLRRFDQILGGALVIVALALVLDGLFALLQHLVVPRGVTAEVDLLRELNAALEDSAIAHALRDSLVPDVKTLLGPLLPADVHGLG